MSSFWNTADGDDIRDKVDIDKDLETGSFEPLPDKTKVLALVTAAGIDEDKDGNRRASVTLEVVKPEGYARRKLFPRFWVYDDNPNAADKAKKRQNDLTRFTKLDAACGGKLARKDGVPSSEDIALAFTGKQVIVNVMLMTPKDGDPFNWYSDYWAKGAKELSEGPKAKASGSGVGGNGGPQRRRAVDDDIDSDDIPFATRESIW